MTLAHWCVLAAALLPYLFTGLAKSSARYDNRAPRRWLEQVEGWRRRAHWAQLNSFEAFAPFAAGVIIAHQAGAQGGAVNALAGGFVVLRLIYGLLYIADRPAARSLVWTAAFGCVLGLFGLAAVA